MLSFSMKLAIPVCGCFPVSNVMVPCSTSTVRADSFLSVEIPSIARIRVMPESAVASRFRAARPSGKTQQISFLRVMDPICRESRIPSFM